ncbi:putative membrane protein [Halanaeroarchaeum sp. HSR-CO]|nr:putative membrane protein [Halanaeroarchaeum sp. HSR-CO]
MKKRLAIGVGMGAILGVFCIVGVGLRTGFQDNELFLVSMWYNRVVMGLVIGLAGGLRIVDSDRNVLVRGFVLGLVVTTAITLTSEFRDWPSFFAGLAYGVIIDWTATKFGGPAETP